MDRAKKRELVTSLNAVFSDTTVLVVAHYKGLNVADMTDLRAKVREAGASIKVAKNSLARLALQGTEIEHVTNLFQGPTIIAYSDDPVAAPKAVADFAKTNDNLVVLGGALGATNLDADGVKALAALPSLDELRGRLIGMISTPATRIAMVLKAPAGQVARVLAAYAKKDEAA